MRQNYLKRNAMIVLNYTTRCERIGSDDRCTKTSKRYDEDSRINEHKNGGNNS